MHRVAILLTERFISKRWIDARDQNWGIYVMMSATLQKC